MSSEDFFADLLPKVAAKESEEDSILPMPISSASSNNGTEKGSKGLGGPAIMQKSKEHFDEKAIHKVLKGFADGIRAVLEGINTRLGSLESSCEQITEKLSDLEDAGLERDKDLKSRLGELGAATRELQRGVQLLRDRQEIAEAQAELQKLSMIQGKEHPNSQAAAPAATVAAPAAPPLASVPAPTAPTAPAPAPPVQAQATAAPAPPAPATSAAPEPQQPQHSAPQGPAPAAQAQYSAQPSPSPAAPPQYSAPPSPSPAAPPQYSAPPPRPSHPIPLAQPQYSAPPAQILQPSHYSGPPPPQPTVPQHPPPPPHHGSHPPPPPNSGYQGSYSQPPAQLKPPMQQAPPPQYRQNPPPSGPPGHPSGFGYGPPPGRPGPPPLQHHQQVPPPGSGGHQTRSVPLDQVIQDVANMGFHPNDVRRVVNEIMQSGQSVDLNVVIDRLTRGGR